jgi:hypothetical protein
MDEQTADPAVTQHAREMAARSWEKTPDRAARTLAGRQKALETFARRRAEKAAQAARESEQE